MPPLMRVRTAAAHARPNVSGDRRRRPRAGARERRSTLRPHFVEGWRKTIAAPRVRAAADPATCIDVWLADTEALLNARSCLALLTEDDWAAATRHQHPTARYSAMASRIVLRLALSRAVDRRIAPSEWRFETAGHDKPVVSAPLPGINFTVSHVDQFTAVAVAPGMNLGIDIESVDQDVDEKVVDAFCHADERRALKRLPLQQRLREFLRLWTRKEACSKLVGLGHSLAFDTIRCAADQIAIPASDAVAVAQVESFFVTAGHSLFHAALAIEPSARAATELQIITLAASQSDAVATPAVSLNTRQTGAP